jgi:hypothetical protein
MVELGLLPTLRLRSMPDKQINRLQIRMIEKGTHQSLHRLRLDAAEFPVS